MYMNIIAIFFLSLAIILSIRFSYVKQNRIVYVTMMILLIVLLVLNVTILF